VKILAGLSKLACLLTLLVSPACVGLGGGNSVNAYIGSRQLDSSDFEDANLEDQNVYGADVVLDLDLPFLGVEGGFFHSDDESGGVEASIDEYFVGLRVTPWDFLIVPYGSVGVSLVDGDLDTVGDDSALGYYARVGGAITFGIVRFGLDARAGFSDTLDLGAVETDADNYQVTAFIGVGF